MFDKLKTWIKGAFKSKTMWFGGLISALGALSDNSQYLKEIIKDDLSFNTTMIVIGLIISVLRIVTTKPLDEK